MSLAGSASAGRFHGNKKRPPTARQRQIEGLTTRRRILLMAGSHPMYPCRSSFGTLLPQEGRGDG